MNADKRRCNRTGHTVFHTLTPFRASARSALLLAAAVLLAGCSYFAVKFAPEKKPSTVETPAAQQANEYFWRTLHAGKYEDLPQLLTALTAAYLENPNDATIAAHLGFAHIWKLSERNRLGKIPPEVTDDAVLARKYFGEAVRLNPDDPRILGFYGVTMMAEGRIHKDEKLATQGYFTAKEAVRQWPEFNNFTLGYVLSTEPHDSALFRDALEWQWQAMDLCYGEKVDRANPGVARYAALEAKETEPQRKRACWNSAIAPHNVEGFFLNMGDMLVKSGDWQTAVKIYENARRAREYSTWPYRAVLDERIATAQANVELFRKTYPTSEPITARTLMFNSKFSCMACHQKQ